MNGKQLKCDEFFMQIPISRSMVVIVSAVIIMWSGRYISGCELYNPRHAERYFSIGLKN